MEEASEFVLPTLKCLLMSASFSGCCSTSTWSETSFVLVGLGGLGGGFGGLGGGDDMYTTILAVPQPETKPLLPPEKSSIHHLIFSIRVTYTISDCFPSLN